MRRKKTWKGTKGEGGGAFVFPEGIPRWRPVGEWGTRPERRPQLDQDDRAHIMEKFSEVMAPKLRRAHARIGTISCEFAGARYKNWNVLFRSRGEDFEITDFEYDADTRPVDLGR